MDSDKSEDYIPWHDDKMKELSHRSDEDAAAAPVLSLSLGESQVFALCPKEDSPTWHKVFSEINRWRPDDKVPATWKRKDCRSVRGPSAT